MKRKVAILTFLLVLVIGMQVMRYTTTLRWLTPCFNKTLPSNYTHAHQTPPHPLWIRSYGGNSQDVAESVVESSGGGFAISGYTNSYSPGGDYDYWLIHTDPNGNLLWEKTYGGSEDEFYGALIECNDGGFALIGSSHSYTLNVSVSYNMWWVRTDDSGNMLWNQPYQHGDSSGSGSGLVECSDGGFALAGHTSKNGLYTYDVWLVRITANGGIVWEDTYGDPAYIEYCQAVVECSGGGFALAGRRIIAGNDTDFYLVRTDANGNELWQSTFHKGSFDQCLSLIECSGGGFALVGRTGPDNLNTDSWLVRTDANGNKLWDKTYGDASGNDCCFSVVECWDGGFALAGFYNGSHTDSDFYLVRIDTNGNTLWEQTYGTGSDDFGLGMMLCGNGDYTLVGVTGEYGYEQAMLMRIPAIIIPGFFLPVDPLLLIGVIIVIIVVIVVLGVFLWRRRRLAVSEV